MLRLLKHLKNSLKWRRSNNIQPKKEIIETLSNSTTSFLGAKEGSFDKREFINMETKKFKFPNYNKGNKKHLVRINDTTNYKENYFEGVSKEEREKFSFLDFERNYVTPDLEIDTFEDFLDRLDDSFYHSELGKGQSIELLSMFDEYLIETEIEPQRFDKNLAKNLASIGFIEISNIGVSKEDYLKDLTVNELISFANKLNLKPYKTKKALISQLLKFEFEVPMVEVTLTNKLVEYFLSFAKRYVVELKSNSDRFYPLYIEAVLKEAENDNYNPYIKSCIQRELQSNYWKDRMLYKRI